MSTPKFLRLKVFGMATEPSGTLDISALQDLGYFNFFLHQITTDEYEELSSNYTGGSTQTLLAPVNGQLNSAGQRFLELLPYLGACIAVPKRSSADNSPFFEYSINNNTIDYQLLPRMAYWTQNSVFPPYFLIYNPQNKRYSNCNYGTTSGGNYATVWDENGNIVVSANQQPAAFGADGSTYNIMLMRETPGSTSSIEFYRIGLAYYPSNYGYPGWRVRRTDYSYNANGPIAAFFADTVLDDLSDPYADGGTSGPGGWGDGNFDFSSTDIPIPGLPNIGAYDTGMVDLFKPSATDLKSLAAYLWSGAFDLDNFRKLVADPMDTIMALQIVPATAQHPATENAVLKVGNISTGITMPRCIEQYYELDCGTVDIPRKWGAYLDYSPYTKLALYLPYVGVVELSPDDCMAGSVRVVYHVDILSGSCTVFVYCVSNRGADGHTLYTFTADCKCPCPVTSGNYNNGLLGLLSMGGAIASTAVAFQAGNATGVVGGINEAANAAISMVKPSVVRSGGIGGTAGLMGIQYPYLILTVPRMCTPGEQNKLRGYPAYMTKTMSDLSGYNSIDVNHMENMTCTAEEIDEIVQIIGEGAIF